MRALTNEEKLVLKMIDRMYVRYQVRPTVSEMARHLKLHRTKHEQRMLVRTVDSLLQAGRVELSHKWCRMRRVKADAAALAERVGAASLRDAKGVAVVGEVR